MSKRCEGDKIKVIFTLKGSTMPEFHKWSEQKLSSYIKFKLLLLKFTSSNKSPNFKAKILQKFDIIFNTTMKFTTTGTALAITMAVLQLTAALPVSISHVDSLGSIRRRHDTFEGDAIAQAKKGIENSGKAVRRHDPFEGDAIAQAKKGIENSGKAV
jgi:hypothetical protein